jgi:hypothetical protein
VGETPTEAEYAVPKLLALLVIHELVGEALLEPSELLCGRFVLLRGERLAGWRYPCGVHRSLLVAVGRVPGCGQHLRGHFLINTTILAVYL